MAMGTDRRIVLITRHTRIDELIYRHNTLAQARFVIESQGLAFDDYLAEDREFKVQLAKLKAELERFGRLHHIDRGLLPGYLFREDDIVLALGQDGLVANTLKYLNGQPLIAVNPDPARYDGILLPFLVEDVLTIIKAVIKGERKTQAITFGEVMLNDGQRLLAVNDFFIGVRGHSSARYEIILDDKRERQSSSGVIVSTGLGSTGWFKSIVTGASRIAEAMGQTLPSLSYEKGVNWDSDFLFYSVREPFPSAYTGTALAFGRIPKHSQLKIVSNMPVDGIIFSDGMEQDCLEFNTGQIARIGVAERGGQLVL
ncbi:MAG: sugar kinase [Candidatus Thiodiazotropha sp. (ex Monitilora ramsayi)]|nr:sugar kinase [Candidatus Thiodiazotropha sp. (ex Monitilora ramsayi)]